LRPGTLVFGRLLAASQQIGFPPSGGFVKKRLDSISFYATVAMICGVMSWGGLLYAQSSPDTQQPPSAQSTPGTQAPASQYPSQQTPDQSGQAPSQTRPSQPSQSAPDPQAQASDASGTQTFTGTVVAQGNKYVLQSDNGTTYDIDHQDQVKKFEGKKVRVHGTLDASGKMIHVQ
jgi:hypothetical protein